MSRLSRFSFALLALLAATLALADPPARVGRLGLVENGVSFRVDRNDEGGPASLNWPISSGAMLATERRGRAEVWVGSTAFRLGGNAQLEFPVVDDRQVAVRLLAGSLAVSLLDREPGDEVSVETPDGRITFASAGRYRIDVRPDHTELTAQAGRAAFSDGARGMPVAAGQKAVVYRDGRMRVDPDVDQDAFDYWVAERENAALASTSRRYVSPAMTGYQDLDNYGDWNSSPEYGAVWYPRAVDDGWAPYRYGRWAWVAPWGWTWIDQSAWGFAPFHYGRWVLVGNRWGWVPGTYVARPVYAPALVAWVGGAGWNVSFRGGNAPAVGWFPLAPHEVYVPGFHASPEYVRQLNRTHVRDAAIVDRALRSGPPRPYLNRGLPQAVTIVPSRQMSEGRPIVPGEIDRHDRRELERAPQTRPAPADLVPPPAGRRPFQDEHRDAAAPRGALTEPRALPPGEPGGRSSPAALEPRTPMPVQNNDAARRGGAGREPLGGPAAARDVPPGRPADVPRNDAGRQPPVSSAVPVRGAEAVVSLERAGPAFRPPEVPREQPRPPVVRDTPALPVGREMPRDDRENRRQEMPRQPEAVARPRDLPQAPPQSAPPPVRVAPPSPAPAAPRVEPRAPEQPRGGNAERRRDPKDEHEGR